MRAKQSNGYDDDFMALCRKELSICAADLSVAQYWVAQADELCGLVGLGRCEDRKVGEIVALFIEPDWQRHGIGRLLWQQACKRAIDAGMSQLLLDADPAAVSFYEAMGARVIGSVPSGSIPGRVLPQMRLNLR